MANSIEAIFRIESSKVIASVARMVRDVGLAEDAAQDALVSALEQWPESGVPENPGAWLTAVAKRKAIDVIRRNETLQRKYGELEPDSQSEPDLLSLIFVACHPVLST